MSSVATKPNRNASEAGHQEALKLLFSPIIDDLFQAELPHLRQLSNDVMTDIINKRLERIPPLRVEISKDGKILANITRQHYLFPLAVKLMHVQDLSGQPLNIALVGPTGTGKTRMCINAAEALKHEFILQPFNPQTTKSELLGYMDATGKYVASPFYTAFKTGKLFIADEFDAANPALATVLNAAISNRVLTFPNGETVKADKNFRCIYCMNTYGTGGDDSYTGRNRLDQATLDRMVFLYVPIDQGLEATLVGIPDIASPTIDHKEGGEYQNEKQILDKIINIRGAIEKEKLRYSVSPRATIHACALHRAGFGRKWIDETCIWRNIPEHQKERLGRLAA